MRVKCGELPQSQNKSTFRVVLYQTIMMDLGESQPNINVFSDMILCGTPREKFSIFI